MRSTRPDRASRSVVAPTVRSLPTGSSVGSRVGDVVGEPAGRAGAPAVGLLGVAEAVLATRPRTAAGARPPSCAARPAGPTTRAAPRARAAPTRVVRPGRALAAASAGRRRRSGSGAGSRRRSASLLGVAENSRRGMPGISSCALPPLRPVGMPATVTGGTDGSASVPERRAAGAGGQQRLELRRGRWCRRRSASSCWCRGSRWSRWRSGRGRRRARAGGRARRRCGRGGRPPGPAARPRPSPRSRRRPTTRPRLVASPWANTGTPPAARTSAMPSRTSVSALAT